MALWATIAGFFVQFDDTDNFFNCTLVEFNLTTKPNMVHRTTQGQYFAVSDSEFYISHSRGALRDMFPTTSVIIYKDENMTLWGGWAWYSFDEIVKGLSNRTADEKEDVKRGIVIRRRDLWPTVRDGSRDFIHKTYHSAIDFIVDGIRFIGTLAYKVLQNAYLTNFLEGITVKFDKDGVVWVTPCSIGDVCEYTDEGLQAAYEAVQKRNESLVRSTFIRDDGKERFCVRFANLEESLLPCPDNWCVNGWKTVEENLKEEL